MKNGIKILVLGFIQLAIASQASAQLVIAPSQMALNLPPLPVVAKADIAKLDLVAIHALEVKSSDTLSLADLASLKADKEASESGEVAVSLTLAAATIPTPPSTVNTSFGDINTTNAGTLVVVTNNNNNVINSTKTPGTNPAFNGEYRDNYEFLMSEKGSINSTIKKTNSEETASLFVGNHGLGYYIND